MHRKVYAGDRRTAEAARRVESVLTNHPASDVMCHAAARYHIAIQCAREHGFTLAMVEG